MNMDTSKNLVDGYTYSTILNWSNNTWQVRCTQDKVDLQTSLLCLDERKIKPRFNEKVY